MKSLFSIGEVSKIKGITIKALRYYHKVGILVPNYIDDETGYRYYSIEQFVYIDIIKGCRELGTSIIELQQIFKERSTERLLEFLKEKREEAVKNIKKMNEIIKDIDNLNTSVEYGKDAVSREEIEIKYYKDRYIVVNKCEESGNLKELLYYSDLDKVIEENQIEVKISRGIIYNVKSNEEVKPVYAFSEINGNNISEGKYIDVLPEGQYLILSYNKENEEEKRQKLFKYATENNLQVETFIEMELFDDFFNIDSYSCQIQIPLEVN